MNEKNNNAWMSIRSLENEYLKMNGNVWPWKFRVWSPGLWREDLTLGYRTSYIQEIE